MSSCKARPCVAIAVKVAGLPWTASMPAGNNLAQNAVGVRSVALRLL